MPRQGIMLCYPFSSRRFERWGNKGLLQPKYNGERMRAIFNSEGKVTLLSSEMNIITSLPHIVNKLQGLHFKNIELDGEAYTHYMDKDLIHSILSRRVNLHPEYESLHYVVFDLVSQLPQEQRLTALKQLSYEFPPEITIVPTQEVNSLDEVEHCIDHIYNDGYEGIVLKQIGSYYTRKRSNAWQKFKPRYADVYLIRGAKQEIDIKGKAKNALGAFICQGDDDTVFRVGSGPLLTRSAREFLWQIRDSLPGKYLLIKYERLTEGKGVPYAACAHAVLSEEEAKVWMNK